MIMLLHLKKKIGMNEMDRDGFRNLINPGE
jgi:hypothetical protein